MTTENAGFACHSNVVDGCDAYDSVLHEGRIIQRKASLLPYRRRSLILSTAIAALICATDGMQPASAQMVTTGGQVNPNPVTDDDIVTPGIQWHITNELQVGDSTTGTLTISAGGTVSVLNNYQSYIGGAASGVGTVIVTGAGSGGNASTWTSSAQVNVGYDGIGTVNVENGGAVNSDAVILGFNSNGDPTTIANGMIIISGHDSNGNASTWTSSGDFVIGNGYLGQGTGMLEISDGGVLHSGIGSIGNYSGGNGHATVAGLGSLWDLHSDLYVGFAGVGELEVLDGAAVSTDGTIHVGDVNGSQGIVSVSSSTGNISTLSSTGDLIVGGSGLGTISIEKGGFVSIDGNTRITDTGTGNGTVHLNGDATGRGILETGSVVVGAGTVDLDLNGGILRANRDEANFLNGFTALTVGTEGAWFDTNHHDIAIGTAFTGTSTFNKLGEGTLTLTGDSSTFTGNTQVQAGTLQVDGTLGGPTEVLAGARLTGIGQVGIITNRGVIAPGHAGTLGIGTLGTLTIAGNYTAASGSIEIRTQLGDDSSPTDRLVITGSTSGTTPVTVTNFGGAGAQTTEGIKIIDVAGASNGIFTLLGTTTYQGDQAIVAGAYAYRLYKGGAATPAEGDWYLRSVVQDTSTPPTTTPTTPLYQPGVPTYEAYSQVLLGLNGVPTLQQRVGNRFWSDGSASSSADNDSGITGAFTETNGMWVRVEGGHNRIDPKYSTSGSNYEYDTTKTQVGLDTMLSQSDSGKLVGGLSVHYVHGSADTNWRYGVGNYGSGDISTDGYGLGGTLTWYGNNGFYVDGTAQMTWYSSDLSAQPIHGLANSNDAFGYALSVESGKRIEMNQGWSFTPQAQLTYSKARFDDFSDVFGASIRPGRDDSLQARLGVSLERQVNRTHLYGIASVYNEFLYGTSVNVDNQTFSSRNDRLWAGIGFGGSHNWNNDKYSIYGEGTYSTSLADGDSQGYGITVGFRARW